MLRAFVLLLGVALSLGGLVQWRLGRAGAGLELLVFGLLVLAGTVFEKRHYGEAGTPPAGPDWERTDETFIDPATERPMVVYQHRVSGQRRYVPLRRE